MKNLLIEEITEEYLKENFQYVRTVTFNEGWYAKHCLSCNSKNLKYHKSEAWTNTYICNTCGDIHFVIRADRMGGSWSEPVSVYKPKN